MIRNSICKLIGAMALTAAVSSVAHADFKGFGSDIPLESAAKQIVPDGWNVDYGEGVDKAATVSWSSADSWQGALSAAVKKKGYSAQFGSNTVVISKEARPSRAKASSSRSVRPYASSPKPSKVQKAAPRSPAKATPARADATSQGGGGFNIRPYRPSQGAKPGHEIVTKGDFEPYSGSAEVVRQSLFGVHSGQMLHTALASWAEQAGWKLIWESDYDYRIGSDASFGGEFIEAVTDLVDAMSDARPSINVNFYKGNNVFVVSNNSSDEVN